MSIINSTLTFASNTYALSRSINFVKTSFDLKNLSEGSTLHKTALCALELFENLFIFVSIGTVMEELVPLNLRTIINLTLTISQSICVAQIVSKYVLNKDSLKLLKNMIEIPIHLFLHICTLFYGGWNDLFCTFFVSSKFLIEHYNPSFFPTWNQNSSFPTWNNKTNSSFIRELTPEGSTTDTYIEQPEPLRELLTVLLSKSSDSHNCILVGPPGSGKTTLVAELAKKIAKKELSLLNNYKVFSFSVTEIMGGTMWRGQLESRVANIEKFITQNPNCIIFIDEIHMLPKLGASHYNETSNVGNMLKPILTHPNCHIIGATTNEEFRSCEEDQAFCSRFTRVDIKPLSKKEMDLLLEKMLKLRLNTLIHEELKDHEEVTLNVNVDCSYTIQELRSNQSNLEAVQKSCFQLFKKKTEALSLSNRDLKNLIDRIFTAVKLDIDLPTLKNLQLNSIEKKIEDWADKRKIGNYQSTSYQHMFS